MINSKVIIDSIMALPGMTEQMREVVKMRLESFVMSMIGSQIWKFMIGSSTTTTTSGTRTYTLTGADNDLDTIMNIRYGTYRKPLKLMEINRFDQDRAGTSTDVGEPYSYCIRSTSNQGGAIYPVIELSGSPSDSSTTIYYDYWKKPGSNPIAKLPDDFQEYILNHMEYLYLNDAIKQNIRMTEENQLFFNLWRKYSVMSSESPEAITESMEDKYRICYGNMLYGH